MRSMKYIAHSHYICEQLGIGHPVLPEPDTSHTHADFVISESRWDVYGELIRQMPSKVTIIGGGGELMAAEAIADYLQTTGTQIDSPYLVSAGIFYLPLVIPNVLDTHVFDKDGSGKPDYHVMRMYVDILPPTAASLMSIHLQQFLNKKLRYEYIRWDFSRRDDLI